MIAMLKEKRKEWTTIMSWARTNSLFVLPAPGIEPGHLHGWNLP